MPTENEKEYLIKALEVFKRKIIVISPDYEILAVSGDFEDIKEGIAVREKCYKVLFGFDSPCIDCPANEVKKTHRPSLKSARSDCLGLEVPSCMYSYPIQSETGINAMVMLDFELPTVEGLEERLRYSNAFLHNLILSAVDAVIASDRKGKIIIFNETAKEVCGYDINEAINSVHISEIYTGKMEQAKEIMRKLRENNGKLKSYKVEIQAKDGTDIPISLNASIVYEGDSEVATIGFFHDLRKSIKIKKELEKTQIQLVQAEKMASLGKLAAGVAHQINNPLGGIILFSKLMLEEYDLPEGAVEDLQRILKDAQRCSDTVKELLEFARQPRQNIRLNDINSAISRTLFLLENQTLFHNIKIEKLFADNLPLIPTDIRQVNHVFMNIILNAAEAMEGNGKLTIKTNTSDDNKYICIEMTDTGPGITDDVLSHIFEPFYTTKEAGKGTGLGLSMVYSIVETHQGSITAKSKVGEGTTFLIKFPVNPVQKNGENKDVH
ncbi:Two component system sensor histidine kinase, PAS domain-containing [Desulfonema limicola]|uniref:histidine kinase n=1 Tax=Desulfonema limicola TaxID=45656 RepID=A0A975B3Q2_9BACT|nr:ATP-binding protein [Desulfonema limicola]QTA78213.1 Two component system sensor histidine kinase, PAS domain-containing [Desulfonema limicola]